MLHPFFRFLTVAAALLILGGCVAKSDYLQKQSEADTLQRQLSAMTDENARLKEQIDRLTAEKEKLAVEKNNLTADSNVLDARLVAKTEELARTIAETTRAIEELKIKNAELEGDKQMLRESIALVKKTKEEEVQTVSRTYEDLLNEMKGEIEQGQIAITELKGKLTVDVVDKILFDSGRAEVKPEGLDVLKRVVEILKTVTDKIIRVEGHTDNVPIAGTLAKRYPTNWELSAARAIDITRYLEKEGLDPALLSAAAFGEYQPVADNETPEGRAKNRRIAIILLPKE
ncbi:MAG: chemotaxis protein MotB [Deltaproteobacteria bacterium RBG_16_58_17]|nr:MAG: chemotaxis protein MotB [Deltaproteobacteria bacterium RBG_16_58_17]OHE16346.1 MAG: chemotaxis protein MotB [Syntrophobacterales bacterium GWC2_56_13]OHE21304.1 MAG: chemotaxis protein MotB [Syntrophobacterales bacterium GWF2_56_9]